MKLHYVISFLLLFCLSCKTGKPTAYNAQRVADGSESKVLVAFGSCNKHNLENVFWDDILELSPDIFIWGGDNIYADTDNAEKLRAMYKAQDTVSDYAALKRKIPIIGTWDDHDYGLNDGGVEFRKKKESQQAFLDFMGVPDNNPRRNQEGIYWAHQIEKNGKTVKILVLDTRYFRDSMTPSKAIGRRYDPSPYGQGTILGGAQWKWLENELRSSVADFNLVVSSIQFLSNEHGFEKWANFPHEVDKMKRILKETKAKGVVFLSGDRHISEFSKTDIDGLNYPLIDFTSSGLTHSYSNFSAEPNRYRVGEVVFSTSFGLLELNFTTNEVIFKMMGDEGRVLQQFEQTY